MEHALCRGPLDLAARRPRQPNDDAHCERTTTRVTKPIILTLDALGDAPVGGKAEGLAKLVRLGLRVPEAFVVVGATPGQLPEDLEARYAELGGKAVAVRSSALGEDSADASFAGQYETILDITGRIIQTDLYLTRNAIGPG